MTLATTIVPLLFELDVDWPLGTSHRPRMFAFILIMLVPALGAIYAIWACAAACWSADEEASKTLEPRAIHQFLQYRNTAQGLLRYNGALVGLSTLATGMLRKAMVAGHYAHESLFPGTLVVTYGGFFALALGLAYVPAHFLFSRKAEELCERGRGDLGLDAWMERREHLRAMLQLDTSLEATFTQAAAITAPLVGALLAEVVPKT